MDLAKKRPPPHANKMQFKWGLLNRGTGLAWAWGWGPGALEPWGLVSWVLRPGSYVLGPTPWL